jgi:adenylate cyclase, class 2
VETEAKFYVRNLEGVEARLNSLGGALVQPRILEQNLRFDLPDGRLRSEGRVLRLRRDAGVHLTYKGPDENLDGILTREEIEFEVGDFDKARQLLEGLGYRMMFQYEKFRTTYDLAGVHVMLDELPYGAFVEIEGRSADDIRAAAARLGLRWRSAIATSYHALFERLHKNLKLKRDDLSFDTFEGLLVLPADLEVEPADE